MSGCRLYLGRLPDSARERDVERFFKGYGRIREMLLKEGYGFVEFNDSRDAEDAVYDLNGKVLCGERVVLEFAKPPGSRRGGAYGGGYDRGGRGYGDDRYDSGYSRGAPIRPRNPPPLRTQYRVNVENLSSRVSWQDLKDYMREAGEVTYADAHKLRQNEGVVEFATRRDMEAAISLMDGKEINGRKIRVSEDKPSSRGKRGRSDSRDRRSGGSLSRSRSPSGGGRRSRSRSAARDSRSRSRSRSPARKESRKSDSRSRSPPKKSRSPSHSPPVGDADKNGRSATRSPVRDGDERDERSVSRSPVRNGAKEDGERRVSRSRSRSRSPAQKSLSRSRSRSLN